MSVTYTIDPGRRFQATVARFAARVPLDVDQVVATIAATVLGRLVAAWPVDTGASKAAWQGPLKRGPAHYVLENDLPYAATIEFGTYRGLGPRTEALGSTSLGDGLFVIASGIFSTQAHAPVRRAIAETMAAFEQQLAQSVGSAWRP